MALNWGIEKVKDWEQVAMRPVNGAEGRKTDALIWACIAVDLPGITEKNAEEFYRRLAYIEKRDGRIADVPLTLEDVTRRIGLWTNVSAMSARAWNAKQKRIEQKRAERAKRAQEVKPTADPI